MSESESEREYATSRTPKRLSPMDLAASETQRQAIIDAVRKGVPRYTAFAKLGHRGTYYQWTKAIHNNGVWGQGHRVAPATYAMICEFMEQLAIAEAEGEQYLVESLHSAVGQVNEKTGLQDWGPAKFLLTHGHPRQNWHPEPPPQQTLTVNVGRISEEARQVRDLSDSELVELGDESWRELLPEPNGDSSPA